jgi:hypothetical protein
MSSHQTRWVVRWISLSMVHMLGDAEMSFLRLDSKMSLISLQQPKCIYIYIYIYIYICVCVYVRVCVRVRITICIYSICLCVYVCMCVFEYVSVCGCRYVSILCLFYVQVCTSRLVFQCPHLAILSAPLHKTSEQQPYKAADNPGTEPGWC